MLHTVKKISNLNTYINSFFNEFKDDIMIQTNKQWHDEDLKGSSTKQWNVMKYYYLLDLLIIVYNEVERTKDLGYNWSYYVNKFDLEKYRKCLACVGIDIDKGLNAFNLGDSISILGIELAQIEDSFIVGDSGSTINPISVKELLETPNYCINYIEEAVVPQGDIEEATCEDFDEVQDPGPDNDDEIID